MKISSESTDEIRAYFSVLGRMRMLAGDPALDFANTFHWREGQQADFIGDYQALVEWSLPAGLLTQSEVITLLAAAGDVPDTARMVHAEAIALRTVWRDCLSGRTNEGVTKNGEDGPERRLAERLNRPLADPALLIDGPDALKMAPSRLLWLPLARIALSIASLQLIPVERRIARCEGYPCGGFFLDNSRSKPRRWCSMDTCGNRAKVRGFRSRMRAEEIGAKGR
jgi:predicted RNA-binding Zn ribbon-like protein